MGCVGCLSAAVPRHVSQRQECRDIEGETARAQEVLQMQADTVRKTLDEGVKQTVIKASQAADTLNVKASQAVDLMEMLTPKAAASVGASSSNSTSSSHRKQRYQVMDPHTSTCTDSPPHLLWVRTKSAASKQTPRRTLQSRS